MVNRSSNRDGDGLIAVDRTVAVIEAVLGTPDANLAELARSTGLSEPTMLRYLGALRKHRIVVRDEKNGTYRLGVRMNEWGRAAPAEMDPRAVASRPLAVLSGELGETVELTGLEGRRLVVLAANPGMHAVSKITHVGEVELWHSTSVGKAILAQSDPAFIDAVLSEIELPRLTPHTISSLYELRRDLEVTKARGFAVDNEESEVGLRCVGVAFRNRSLQYAFAISVSGPTYRMPRERAEEIAGVIRRCALEIEAGLGIEDAAEAL